MLPIAKRPTIGWDLIVRHLTWPAPAPSKRRLDSHAEAADAVDDLAWLGLCATGKPVDVDTEICRLALIRPADADDSASLAGRFM